ncbi:MAG TPA: twin-arginine translocase TatA/TatE family subunit [Bacillota bacterium]|nr:twin-arginine translocase TatA/TatE family subunit [Bacillota bacterium]
MLGLGVPELILILVVALIIFGPGKLPEVGKALGKGISEFKKASSDIQKDFVQAMEDKQEQIGDKVSQTKTEDTKS